VTDATRELCAVLTLNMSYKIYWVPEIDSINKKVSKPNVVT